MEKFDKKYYDDIWGEIGSVHRHDYCDSLANQLILKYGKVRFLDIGTGCGYLVKVLREKGCDAWGLEISDYALENSCAKDFIRKGDIRNIPFGSNSFDVVHSSGVWGYFPENDIQKAWAECKRVGKKQEHNIDYEEGILEEHQYLVKKPKEWWDNQFYPKILVACSTFDGKRYCLEQWYEAYKKLDDPNKELLMVDNSDNNYVVFLKNKGINAVHLNIGGTNNHRINQSNEYIRKYFLTGDYYKWFNLESDVLVPSETLNLLLNYNADWIGCCYKDRENKHFVSEWGCSLFSRKIMEETSFIDATQIDTVDGYWWVNQVEPKKYTVVNLYNFLDIKHL